ncbi:MFS transporter [Murinocardiopsis flavida]|nr:MFS transporter [Murinocardiopsis flavida]
MAPTPSDPPAPGVRARDPRTAVLIGLMTAVALAAIDSTIVATAVPSIVGDLGSYTLYPWMFSGFLLTQAVSIPFYARLADTYGRKPLLLVGTAVFLAASVLAGAAWSMEALIAGRVLQGVGAGAIGSISMTIAGDLYPVAERGRANAALSSVWGISAVLGPAVGGLFSDLVSWRWIFLVNIPVGLVALWLVHRNFTEVVGERPNRARLDVGGAVLLLTGATLIMLGLLESGTRWAWGSVPSTAVLAAGAAATAAFAWWENRAAAPMMPPRLWTRRVFIGVNTANAAVGVLLIAPVTMLPTFAQGVLGAGAAVAGFVVSAQSIGWPAASSLSAHLYMRAGFRQTALLGVLFTLTAGTMLLFVDEGTALGYIALCCLVQGAGLGLLSTSTVVGVQSLVPWDERGVVTGAAMFSRSVGSAVGAAVFGAVANSTLSTWFAGAPERIRGALPQGVDEAGAVLARADDPEVLRYVQEGLTLATHRVFLGLLVVSAVAFVALAATARRWEPHHVRPRERG